MINLTIFAAFGCEDEYDVNELQSWVSGVVDVFEVNWKPLGIVPK